MRGKNEIHMNQLTMQHAVQLWLNDQFKEPPTVGRVLKNNNVSAVGHDQFVVTVDGIEKQTT
jgi:hypothetical protein